MKRQAIFAVLISIFAAGCHGQIPVNPNVPSCPVPNGSNYTALNQSTPATALTYSDTPAAGTWCYVAQSVKTVSGVTYSSPVSNVSNPAVITGLVGAKTATITWGAPLSGPTPDGYVISRATATISVLGAPALNAPTTALNEVPTALPGTKLEATLVAPANVTAKLFRK